MAPAAGINSSPATPHSGSSNPAVGATTNRWTTPGCSRTGLTVGGFSGTVITSGGGGGGAGAGAGRIPARFGIVVLHSGRPPVAECHFRRLDLPRRVGAVIRAGPFIGRARFATRSDSARRTAVGVGSRAAAAIAVRSFVVRDRRESLLMFCRCSRPTATVAVRAFAIIRMAANYHRRVGDRDGRAGPTYQKTCGHDANTCREAEVRLGQGSSPASGKDMQTRANCILACRCRVEEQLRTMHANLR